MRWNISVPLILNNDAAGPGSMPRDICATIRSSVASSASTSSSTRAISLNELPERRVVLADFGPHDVLETPQITRRPADPGHAGTLVAEQEFCVGPALVFLADQIFDGDAHVLEEDVVHLVRPVDGDDRAAR